MTIVERIKKLFRFEEDLEAIEEKIEQPKEEIKKEVVEFPHKPLNPVITISREELIKELHKYVEEQKRKHKNGR